MKEFERWQKEALDDGDLIKELQRIEGNEEEIKDRFYRDLEFGTAGLRGVIGVGTNRMNVYTVRKATQGLADYLDREAKKQGAEGKVPTVAIAYDSRHKGVSFAQQSAQVLAANGIKAYLYAELMPTPALSWAIRELKCDAGICVTASHNPAKYNGYKVYGDDGCQMTSDMADGVTEEIEKLDVFTDIRLLAFDEGISSGSISYISEDVAKAFINAVHKESLLGDASNLKVVYTPLNGSGKRCVLSILDRIGVKDITLVSEQSEPDGDFPTCSYPNPETKEALKKGLDLCEKVQPDLLLATDPDCDRVGIATKCKDKFELLTGNEVGALLLEFIAKVKEEQGRMPKNPVAVTTIVSTDLVNPIAKAHNIEIRRVLTGFKYIGNLIAELEADSRVDDYLLGFEESCGYLSGGYVRDKDAVNASMLICEMASYYKTRGQTLADAIHNIYEKYGYYKNDTESFAFEGEDGIKIMDAIMTNLRENPPKEIACMSVSGRSDYGSSRIYEETNDDGDFKIIDLPKSNVLEYRLENGSKLIVRPSGTEPKIKVYLSAKADSQSAVDIMIDQLRVAAQELLRI